MKPIDWNEDKNKWLKEARGVSFEEIVTCINEDKVVDIIIHPNQMKYTGQKMFIIKIEGYAYMVPFVEDEGKIFLKTIIPSRKATRDYLNK